MAKLMFDETLQRIINKTVDNKKIFGATVCIQKSDNSFCFNGSAGNFQDHTQYFIASVTKLYITAVILKLRGQGQVNIDDQIARYLPLDILEGLHVYNGVEYSRMITVRHLMAHTSGLPDYFLQKSEGGKSLLDDLTSGNDRRWSFEDAVLWSKKMTPKFKPGTKGKAFYADTNYQLLGKIIEQVTGEAVAKALAQYIFVPLGLTKTYLYQDSKDAAPVDMYCKKKPLSIPMAMTSFGPDGGIVSTADELMIFIKAFFQGQLFRKDYLDELKAWNRIFFPLQSGVGLHRFKLPRLFSPFKPFPEFLGHSGLSGAFAFYVPDKEVFLTGTVNQINHPDKSFKMMLKLISKL